MQQLKSDWWLQLDDDTEVNLISDVSMASVKAYENLLMLSPEELHSQVSAFLLGVAFLSGTNTEDGEAIAIGTRYIRRFQVKVYPIIPDDLDAL